MNSSYWQRQATGKPLFPDIEWNKPERKDQAGRLLIVGGNKLGFSAVAESYETAKKTGAGQVRVLLPDCLKPTVPKTLLDVVFAGCNPSGGLNQEAKAELLASAAWANGVLLIGDAGKNAETAVLYEQFILEYRGQLTINRDAIDLLKNSAQHIVERDQTVLVASFSQVQKLFQTVYYPKILTYSMQLLQAVEALHKFTITYQCTIVTLHKDTLIIANGGNVITQPWDNPMAIWRGSVATNAASYILWNPSQSIESIATSIAN